MKYPCPCCGYLVFDEIPGSFAICPICYWEDDLSQLRFPETTGANKVSLIEGQKNYIAFGASEKRLTSHVRRPTREDVRDPRWRQIDTSKDRIEKQIGGMDYGKIYKTDRTEYYYWK